MKDETKNILGISCLYATISSLFALLGRVETVFSADSPREGIKYFLSGSLLWLAAAGIIIYILYSLNAKQKQGYAAMLNSPLIRKTTGILLAVTGALSFSSLFPAFVNTIVSFRTFDAMSLNKDSLVKSSVTQTVALLIELCELLFGLYLIRYRSKTEGRRA